MKIILEDEGLQLAIKNNQYYLIFDSGELAVQMTELAITNKEAEEIIINPNLMYDTIIKYQNLEMFGK